MARLIIIRWMGEAEGSFIPEQPRFLGFMNLDARGPEICLWDDSLLWVELETWGECVI